MGLGYSRQGGLDQSAMYLLSELSSLKKTVGTLGSVDSNLINLADKLTDEVNSFKKTA